MPFPLFTIGAGDGRAIYRQIVEQVKAALVSGRLAAGDRLPTHRDLARELVVAPLTVKKAYDVLQDEGLVVMRQGRGTFVSATLPAGVDGEAEQELDERLGGLVRQARLMGLSAAEVKRRVDAAWKESVRESSGGRRTGRRAAIGHEKIR